MSISVQRHHFLMSRCFLFLIALLTGCAPNATTSKELDPTYVLLLADTSLQTPEWLTAYRRNSAHHVTVVVSGEPGETTDQLLRRLPWLLQPGVDTLYIDRTYRDYGRICDSLGFWSPSTQCIPR